MKNKTSFGIVGGDLRSVYLANKLYKEDSNILVYGIDDSDILIAPKTNSIKYVANADVLILPLPTLNKAGNINAPLCRYAITIDSLLAETHRGQLLLCGNPSSELCSRFQNKGLQYIDYFKNEALTISNAMITAEGGIQTLLNIYPKTLCNSHVLVLGYGRIGKFCAKILNGFGAKITVAGRRNETRAWVESTGYTYSDINSETTYKNLYDIVINTVPEQILTQERLDALKQSCLILDLASNPGGTDFQYAKNIGIQAVHAISLPGKTAPESAGEAIKLAIEQICNEVEV